MMNLKTNVSVEEVINLMNELLELDRKAVEELVEKRVLCNEKLADHPTVQVGYDKKFNNYKVGLLGILNGLFGTDENGYGAICINIEDGKLINFSRMK